MELKEKLNKLMSAKFGFEMKIISAELGFEMKKNPLNPFSPTSNLKIDLGFDSLGIELVTAIEDEFGIKLQDVDVNKFVIVGDIYKF